MDHTTSIPLLGVYLAVLGLGVGMSMQNLVLAVQNTVDVTEVGAASSLVAFLRSMGGTIGVTVLGIVLSHRVSALLGVPASGASSGTSDLSQLDAAAAAAVRAAYGDAIGRVFLIAAIGSILTLVAVAFIKEVPLRTTVGRDARAPAAVPEPPAPISAPVLPPAGDGRPRRARAGPTPRLSTATGCSPPRRTVRRTPSRRWTTSSAPRATWPTPGAGSPRRWTACGPPGSPSSRSTACSPGGSPTGAQA